MILFLNDMPLPNEWWPDTVAGWVTLALSVIALMGFIIGIFVDRHKRIAQLNGYGKRLNKAETAMTEMQQSFDATMRSLNSAVERTLESQRFLLEKVGRAEAMAAQCNDEAERYRIDIGSKVDELRKSQEKWQHMTELALERLVTELRTRQLIGGPTRREDAR